ncbi:hypothetical protein [Streptomyces zhihengii]|uniref:hypothetical protein n=1 Tax=Streptomyces zhihengii TaxID=1818004 RepID=UPI0033A4145B
MNGMEAVVVGYTGPAAQPRKLVLRLPGGKLVLSADMPEAMARAVATYLTGPGPLRRLPSGTTYTSIHESLIAELAGYPHRNGAAGVLRVY